RQVTSSIGNPVAMRSRWTLSSISPGSKTLPPREMGGDDLTQSTSLITSSANASGSPNDAGSKAIDSMLFAKRSAVGALGLLAYPPVSEPARISQKKDRPEPLWPPKGRMAPGGLA